MKAPHRTSSGLSAPPCPRHNRSSSYTYPVNFNVYLDDTVARRLELFAKRTGRPRNAIIRQAVATWLEQAQAEWPSVVLEWKGDASVPPFEQARRELLAPVEDPFLPARSRSGRAKRVRGVRSAT